MSYWSADGGDPRLDVATFADQLERRLGQDPDLLGPAARPIPSFEARVAALRGVMAVLHDEGWSRYGWPVEVGGLGGTILHRAALWEALVRHGVPGMELFEHHEILAPALVAMGPRPLVAELLPAFLSGRELWCQGFSEPDAGSDLAALRTTARRDGDQWILDGRKIWTSWARYADRCLVLARTGTTESRHRGLTAFVVDLDSPGVEPSAIVQANGTDELAEVAFDGVVVPDGRVVGEVDGGWKVAIHILSHERGTFAWFRHLAHYQRLAECLELATEADDDALGDAFVDLAAVSATSRAALDTHATGAPLGPRAAYTKLLLCAAEQSTSDVVLATDGDLVLDTASDEALVRRQDYLFSRIVTVYGGSQQMQLETIAKQNLRLP